MERVAVAEPFSDGSDNEHHLQEYTMSHIGNCVDEQVVLGVAFGLGWPVGVFLERCRRVIPDVLPSQVVKIEFLSWIASQANFKDVLWTARHT